MAARASAEEFYSRCLGNVTMLDAASRQFAESGETVNALATAWGADVYAVQAVVWERILVASSYPQRQFFRVAEALVTGVQAAAGRGEEGASAADVLALSRAGLLSACEPGLREGVEAAWQDVSYLATLPAPTKEDLDANVVARTGGAGLSAFVAQRRQEAADLMAQAQALRIKGSSVPAIQAAYESDLGGLEAYLVESAAAVGDHNLLTVTVRWELATRAVATLPGLPDGFVAAVTRIREAFAGALGEADGQRLRELLPAL